MRILFGILIAIALIALIAVFVPDAVAQTVYRLHDVAQTGKANPQYKWVKVEATASPDTTKRESST